MIYLSRYISFLLFFILLNLLNDSFWIINFFSSKFITFLPKKLLAPVITIFFYTLIIYYYIILQINLMNKKIITKLQFVKNAKKNSYALASNAKINKLKFKIHIQISNSELYI